MTRYQRHEAEVPFTAVWLPEGEEITVTFDWCPGTPASGLSGPPENYDPGEGDEFVIVQPLCSNEVEDKLVEWLDANWDRPEIDHGPDPDDAYDRMRDDRLTGDA